MERRSPASVLRATIKVGPSSGEFSLTDFRGKTLRIENSLSIEMLRVLRDGLDSDLESFRTAIGARLEIDNVAPVARALKVLLKRGRNIGNYLLNMGKYHDKREEVRSYFIRCCPNWLTVDPLRTALAPPLLEVESSQQHVVPLEFVPFVDFSEPEPSEWETWEGLEAIMKRLPLFSMVVQRRFTGLRPVSCFRLKNEPKLKVKLFQHVGLKCADSEAEFFQANEHSFDAEGPWPSPTLLPGKFIELAVRHLTSPGLRWSEGEEGVDQIHHFACHGLFNRDLPENSSLILAHTLGKGLPMSLKDLNDAMMSLEAFTDSTDMPFVFLNACEGAVMHAGTASFAWFFLFGNGNRGFLSAECKIPNRVAAKFASLFYKFLLSGYSAGHALYLAKWKLFKDYRNPLGALYTLYGCTDLRVTRPVSEVVLSK